MQAERGIKQHGHAIELESVGRKWKECTDRVKAKGTAEENWLETAQDVGLLTCPCHA